MIHFIFNQRSALRLCLAVVTTLLGCRVQNTPGDAGDLSASVVDLAQRPPIDLAFDFAQMSNLDCPGYGRRVWYPSETAVPGIAVADINDDGWPDALNGLPPYFGIGKGALARAEGIPPPVPSYSPLADFNKDGVPDFEYIDNRDRITVYVSRGRLQYTKASYELRRDINVPTWIQPEELAVGDYDGDGNEDLFVLNRGCCYSREEKDLSSLVVLLGKGDGTFRPLMGSMDLEFWRKRSDVLFGLNPVDFDRDGKTEFLMSTFTDLQIRSFRGPGVVFSFKLPESGGRYLDGDANLDGNPDLIIDMNSHLLTLLGDGKGKFPNSVKSPVDTDDGARLLTDVNRDGKPDLVTADRNGVVHFYRGDGKGLFAAAGTCQLFDPAERGPYGLRFFTMADMNKDGKMDMVFSESHTEFDEGISVALAP